MKTTIFSILKSTKILTFTFLMLCALLVSCEKEATTTTSPEAAITDEEAVALVEGALAMEAEGMSAELESAIEVSQVMLEKSPTNAYCGINNDSTVVKSFNSARFSGELSTTWQWMLNCTDDDLPIDLSYARKGNVNYESLRMISDDLVAGEWTMSNLSTGTAYLFHGSYQRSGSQESKVRDQRTFTSEVKFVLSDLSVGKLKRRINSGTATFSIIGKSSDGQSYNVEGSIEFMGSGSATVTINGETYTIDLY